MVEETPEVSIHSITIATSASVVGLGVDAGGETGEGSVDASGGRSDKADGDIVIALIGKDFDARITATFDDGDVGRLADGGLADIIDIASTGTGVVEEEKGRIVAGIAGLAEADEVEVFEVVLSADDLEADVFNDSGKAEGTGGEVALVYGDTDATGAVDVGITAVNTTNRVDIVVLDIVEKDVETIVTHLFLEAVELVGKEGNDVGRDIEVFGARMSDVARG